MIVVIDVYDCLYDNPGISIAFPRSSGILEGISYQSTGSDEVIIELPSNWYENNDLLGFFVYCVWVSFGFGSHLYECDLEVRGNDEQEHLGSFSFGSSCLDFHLSDCDISDIALIMCYPKAAIYECYRSKQWTHFTASFIGKTRVEGCGIHLIYAKDYEQMHPSIVQGSSSLGNSGDHGLPT